MDAKENLEQIKNSLSLDQIEELLHYLGAEPQRHGNIIISQTICHNHPGEGSRKLYYYNNTKLFRCFTECGDTFDVFQLIMKIREGMALPQAKTFIIQYFNLLEFQDDFTNEQEELPDWKIIRKYIKNSSQEESKQIIELKNYDKNVLKYLPRPRIIPWEREHIDKDVMQKYGICYNPSSQGIVIPHYDINNNLVGIRERTLIKENEIYGKYKPSILNGKMYNHPLAFNLYNLNNSKDNIKVVRKAFVFESEKSCLLYASYFGIENDLSVAVCGSSLGSYQMSLLLDLGIEEVIIAFDRQYQELNSEEHLKWSKKLKEINKKYRNKVVISFMFDKEDLLGYKDSPIDCGKDKFLTLFENRIII